MAQPPFTRLQNTVFDIVTKTMGYDASWLPVGSVDGGLPITGKVTFKDPHSDRELSGFAFTPKTHIAEWKSGDFLGLETAFSVGDEQMTVNGITYSVVNVKALYDGLTYQAVLERIELTGD